MAKKVMPADGGTYDRATAARELGISIRTLERWTGQGIIKVVRVGPRRVRVPVSEVVRILNGQDQAGNGGVRGATAN